MFTLDRSESIPNHTITEVDDVITIDSAASTLDGLVVGSTSGTHRFAFIRDRLVPDILDQEMKLSFQAGSNVELINGTWGKSTNNNAWDASIRSNQSFDASSVFAVSWKLDQAGNWAKLMGGLTSKDTGDSYRKLNIGIYLLNNYLYNHYWLSGKSKLNDGYEYDDREIQVGDRFILSVSAGVVKIYILKAGVLYYMGTPSKSLSGNVKLMFSFNRGKNKSGKATLTDAYLHTGTMIDTTRHVIGGAAADMLSAGDIDCLQELGYNVLSGSTYGKIQLSRINSSAFTQGGLSTPCNIVHEYFGINHQSSSQF